MRKFSILIALLIAITRPAISQEYTPKAEIEFGYSYSRAEVPNSTSRVNMNGVLVGAVANVNRWLGVEFELGSHYHCISGCWIDGIRVDNPDAKNDSLSFLTGPKLTLTRNGRYSPWVHSLFGITRVSYLNVVTDTRIHNTGFGMAVGGGLDWRVSKVASIRVLQVDYTRFAGNPDASNNVRLGAGVVLHIGHRSDKGQ
jgi:hypothetical protein